MNTANNPNWDKKGAYGYSDICAVYDCKPRWVTGRGSFEGWKLLLCKEHQIIHEMRKIKRRNDTASPHCTH